MKRNTFDPSSSLCFYLNQNGSRAVRIDRNGRRETLKFSPDGGKTVKEKSVCFWQAVGNHAVAVIRVKGKQIRVFPDDEMSPAYFMEYKTKMSQVVR